MSSHRALPAAPLWLRDPRVRRMISAAIKRRRAKRQRELAKFETAIRQAEEAGRQELCKST